MTALAPRKRPIFSRRAGFGPSLRFVGLVSAISLIAGVSFAAGVSYGAQSQGHPASTLVAELTP